jgi:hypothetical protein
MKIHFRERDLHRALQAKKKPKLDPGVKYDTRESEIVPKGTIVVMTPKDHPALIKTHGWKLAEELLVVAHPDLYRRKDFKDLATAAINGYLKGRGA